MAKWIFALLVFLGASVYAHELQPQNDGCALLDEIIYEEVTAAAWGLGDTRLTDMSASGAVVCAQTTHTASKAFSSAMQSVGMDVTWNLPIEPDMDACLSGIIERCVTTPSPHLVWGRLDDSFFVSNTWSAVSKVVKSAMLEGTTTDRSIFSRDSLRLAIRSAVLGRQADVRSGRSHRRGRTDRR